MQNDWMIYGANGYTGRLIALEAVRRRLRPILAGRNRPELEALGRELNLPVRVFACADPETIARELSGVRLVLHCAGPFSLTSAPMLAACLRSKTHYLDITGEIAVFENVFRQSGVCQEAGIVAIPGVGFDVVPSDCLAALLKTQQPDASHLALAMRQVGSFSPGTLKTVIENLDGGGMIREGGKLKAVSSAHRVRKIRFRDKLDTAVTIPWGDVSTAYYSTGIPNIEFYSVVSPSALAFLRAKKFLNPVLSRAFVKRALRAIVDARVSGPDQHERENIRTWLWGEVENPSGAKRELRLTCPESYQLTVDSSLSATALVLGGKILPGVKTPSQAFGADFVLGLNGVNLAE